MEFCREDGKSFPKYLLEFNNGYREVKKYKLSYEDEVLSCFLLAAANIPSDHWLEQQWNETVVRVFSECMLKLCQWMKSAYMWEK